MKKFFLAIVVIILLIVVAFFGIGLLAPDYRDAVSVEVNAPIEKTFAVFNNTDNLPKWMNTGQMKFISIESISGNKNEPGSKWKMVFMEGNRKLEMVETVIAFKENELFAFNIKDAFADFDIEVTFEGKGGNTIITERNEQGDDLGIFSKVMVTLFKGNIHDQKLQMYEQLKKLVEQQ